MARATTSRGASDASGMVGVHERRPVAPAEDGALAAHRLADQEGALARRVERRGVELDELHVRHLRPRPVRHRHPVARRDRRVGGVAVDLAAAARGQHHRAREDRHRLPRLRVQHQQAAAALAQRPRVRRRQQVDRGGVLQMRIPAADTAASSPRSISRPVRSAARTMRRRECPPSRPSESSPWSSLKCTPQLDQLAHARRPLAHQHVHRVGVAEPRAGDQRVLLVQLGRVVRPERRRDPALRPVGAALGAALLGDDRHRAVRDDLEREEQPRDPAPDHHHVGAAHGSASSARRSAASSASIAPGRSFTPSARARTLSTVWGWREDAASPRPCASSPPAGPRAPRSRARRHRKRDDDRDGETPPPPSPASRRLSKNEPGLRQRGDRKHPPPRERTTAPAPRPRAAASAGRGARWHSTTGFPGATSDTSAAISRARAGRADLRVSTIASARASADTPSRQGPRGSRRGDAVPPSTAHQHDVELARQPPVLEGVVEHHHVAPLARQLRAPPPPAAPRRRPARRGSARGAAPPRPRRSRAARSPACVPTSADGRQPSRERRLPRPADPDVPDADHGHGNALHGDHAGVERALRAATMPRNAHSAGASAASSTFPAAPASPAHQRVTQLRMLKGGLQNGSVAIGRRRSDDQAPAHAAAAPSPPGPLSPAEREKGGDYTRQVGPARGPNPLPLLGEGREYSSGERVPQSR
jgi:hypothetical protein